ncbi:MAG: tetratricopeptide repeat protein [Bryobacteraceae bacterium]
MATPRTEMLKSLLTQDPKNTFARYGLAMEYANTGQAAEAVAEYRLLMESNPDYAAAYFHCGQTLERMGQLDEARATYQQGIEVTTRIGDLHTRSELQGALDILG